MSDEQKTWTMDDSALASNPGGVRLNPLQWARHYPKWPTIWACSLMFFLSMALLVHWSFWILAGLLLAINWLYWQRIREHYRYGDLNPGVIVSLNPMMFAVATDLTRGVGEYPAVKILEKSLPTVCGEVPQVGSRLGTVSLYAWSSDPNSPRWANFDPRPIDCAMGNADAIKAIVSTFTEDDWKRLESCLAEVPRPYRPGLFRLPSSE